MGHEREEKTGGKTETENIKRKAGKKEGRNKKRAIFGCVLSLHIPQKLY